MSLSNITNGPNDHHLFCEDMDISHDLIVSHDEFIGHDLTVTGNIIGHIGNIDIAAVTNPATDNKGATYIGALSLEAADGTHNGIVSIIAQSFGGNKTFENKVNVNAASAPIDQTGALNINEDSGEVINICEAGVTKWRMKYGGEGLSFTESAVADDVLLLHHTSNNVSIGNTNNTHKLDVTGDIHASTNILSGGNVIVDGFTSTDEIRTNLNPSLNIVPATKFQTDVSLVNGIPNLIFQNSGAGNEYIISSAANPGQNTAIHLLDPQVTSCNMMLDNTADAVTQLTSNATAITLNKRAGLITMFAATAGGATDSFVLNNAYIIGTSKVIAFISNVSSGTSFIAPRVTVSAIGAGVATINVINLDAAHALSAAAIVQFIVI